MGLFILLISILFIPLNIKTIIHNNKITIYLIILKIKFKVLNMDNIINFEEKSDKEVKSSRTYKIFKKKIYENKNYLKKIDFLSAIKKISSHVNLSIDATIEFGLERRDLTALIYGLLCSIFPIVSTLIHKFIKEKNFIYKVCPNFNKVFLNIKVVNNIKTNLFNLIFIIFILVKEILRVRRIYKVK